MTAYGALTHSEAILLRESAVGMSGCTLRSQFRRQRSPANRPICYAGARNSRIAQTVEKGLIALQVSMTFTCSPTIEYRNVRQHAWFHLGYRGTVAEPILRCAKTSLRDAIQTNEGFGSGCRPTEIAVALEGFSAIVAIALHQKLIIRRGEKKGQCCGTQRQKFSPSHSQRGPTRARPTM